MSARELSIKLIKIKGGDSITNFYFIGSWCLALPLSLSLCGFIDKTLLLPVGIFYGNFSYLIVFAIGFGGFELLEWIDLLWTLVCVCEGISYFLFSLLLLMMSVGKNSIKV